MFEDNCQAPTEDLAAKGAEPARFRVECTQDASTCFTDGGLPPSVAVAVWLIDGVMPWAFRRDVHRGHYSVAPIWADRGFIHGCFI